MIQEDEFLYIVNEVSDALILITELWQLLFKVCHRLILFLVIDARAACSARFKLPQSLLVPLFTPIFQLLLKLKQRSQTGAALQDRDKIKAAVLLDEPHSTSLAKGAKLVSRGDIICAPQALVCLGMQIFHVPVNDFSECHTLL